MRTALSTLHQTRVTLLLLTLSGQALATDIRPWERKPIDVPLPVGEERIIEIDRNMRVGLPAHLADPEKLRVQSADGAIYLKAFEPFDTQRVQLQDVKSGQMVLLDLNAVENASSETIRIILDKRPDPTSDSSPNGPTASAFSETGTATSIGAPTPVRLTRYAAQSLYAPLRAVEPVPGIHRVPMRLPENLAPLIPTLPIEARPLAAWKLDGLTVTAVALTNRDPNREHGLDPRALEGRFRAATFMHTSLGPAGSAEATTTVFLVTDSGLHQALPQLDSAQATANTNDMKEERDAAERQ